jgi:hypothetical protein
MNRTDAEATTQPSSAQPDSSNLTRDLIRGFCVIGALLASASLFLRPLTPIPSQEIKKLTKRCG